MQYSTEFSSIQYRVKVEVYYRRTILTDYILLNTNLNKAFLPPLFDGVNGWILHIKQENTPRETKIHFIQLLGNSSMQPLKTCISNSNAQQPLSLQ